MQAEKVKELLGIFSFESGVAWPSDGENMSDQKAVEILRANRLIKSCQIDAENHIHVDLKNPIGPAEILNLRVSLRQSGVEFRPRKKVEPLKSLQNTGPVLVGK